jgi:hypothetical protein|tara:strand:+ start:94 stop:486 length:393 start_codon:yes stop_codon:yes gene_type:complete
MNTKLDKILTEISAGELIDKITILEIKKVKIKDQDKVNDIDKELTSLNQTFKKSIPDRSPIQDLILMLKSKNLELWDIEENKRIAEKNNDFGKDFIILARNVYKFNDQRAEIKKKINKILGSNIEEVKSY